MSKTVKKSEKQQASTRSTASIAAPVIPEHVLSQLRFDPSLPEYHEYCERLSGLIEKPFDGRRFVCWAPLEKVGLDVSVKDTLKQKYLYSPDGKRTYYDMYQEWEDLLCTDMPVFEGLCWEFYSTYFLKEEPEGMKDKEFMRFRLNGVAHQMSMEDFTRCLRIYSNEEMRERHFNDYIWSGARVSAMYHDDFDPNEVWKAFSTSCWSHHDGDGPLRIDMDGVEFRLIHLFLTLNIFHRSEYTDRVSLSDLWYLEQIRSKTRVNIPYCVAYYLKHFAATGGRTICGGHFVTLIVHQLRLYFDDAAREEAKEVARSGGFIDHDDYVKANVISEPVEEEKPEKEQVLGEGDSIFEILNRMEEVQLQQEQTFKERITKLKEEREQTVRLGFDKLFERMAEIEKLSKKRIAELEKLSRINVGEMGLQPARDVDNVS